MHLDSWAPVFAALLLLIVPLDWLTAALCAAAVHELGHILAIRLLGGKINGMRIGLQGAIIETDIPGGWKEFICALAGPAGSFLLLPLCHRVPKLALCALLQGSFNLLPIYPLDGGRMLATLVQMYIPQYANCILKATKITLIGILCTLIVPVCTKGSLPNYLGFFILMLFTRRILRKFPCKPGESKVQ